MSDHWDILVVDDEPVVRDATRLVLEDAGYTVAVVPDAESALLHRALPGCRLVICDLMLPGQSGPELTRAIRALHPALPIMMITGYATAENRDRALEAGATECLAKPFDDVELLTLVQRVIASPRAAREEEVP
jgi:CheY-like chemotaxis protein